MTRFAYAIVYVPDVPATVAFWQAAFGLELRFAHEAEYAELETGGTALAFATEAVAAGNAGPFQPNRPDAPPAGIEVGLLADDVPAAFARATAAGAVAVKPPSTKPWGQVVAYVRDPNGVLVELCTPVGG